MSSSQELARQALRAALETRRLAAELKTDPICVYDVAEKLGIEVRFCGGNSFGGMYAKASKAILVPALRPTGRQVFTCAHEMGHWYFEHGSRIDELCELAQDPYLDPDERLANMYAGYLLMPRWAVDEALGARDLEPEQLTPVQTYAVACQFAVGYETLVQHLRWSLGKVSAARAAALLKVTPKQIRQDVITDVQARHLVVVDRNWRKIPVDLQIGDVAVVEPEIVIDGRSARTIAKCPFGTVVEAVSPGVSLAQSSAANWAVAIRVRRKDFEGRAIYRHLEDDDVD